MIDIESEENIGITVTKDEIENPRPAATALGNGENRRNDRRRRIASTDTSGLINEAAYRGIDRRSGVDRREVYNRRNEDLIREDRKKFLVRTAIVSLIITTFFTTVFFVLFTPEFIKLREFAKAFDFKGAIAKLEVHDTFYMQGFLNHKIEEAEQYFLGVSTAVEDTSAAAQGGDLAAIGRLFERLEKSQDKSSATETAATRKSIGNLRELVLQGLSGDPTKMTAAIEDAANVDGVLRGILEPVSNKNVAAAAMLIVLNEFRDNIYSGNSYESDIKVIKKLAGNDPEVNAAIEKLLPYAKNGVMSKDTLTIEFKGLAQDIILAKMKGEDANVKAHALQRFEEISKKVRAGDETDQSEEAIVARAEFMLHNGRVASAVAELQKLEGQSANQASGWIKNATGAVEAGNSTDYVVQELVGNIANSSGMSPEGLIKTILGKVGVGTGGGGDFSFVSPAYK